jgi:hypothetical protein
MQENIFQQKKNKKQNKTKNKKQKTKKGKPFSPNHKDGIY